VEGFEEIQNLKGSEILKTYSLPMALGSWVPGYLGPGRTSEKSGGPPPPSGLPTSLSLSPLPGMLRFPLYPLLGCVKSRYWMHFPLRVWVRLQ
jgi:hypothetical protein